MMGSLFGTTVTSSVRGSEKSYRENVRIVKNRATAATHVRLHYIQAELMLGLEIDRTPAYLIQQLLLVGIWMYCHYELFTLPQVHTNSDIYSF